MTPKGPPLYAQGTHHLPGSMIVELTDNDDSGDDGPHLWMAQDAEESPRAKSTPRPAQRSSTIIPRNLPITIPFVKIDSFTFNGTLLAERVCVELQDRDFFKIVHIIQDVSTSAVTLRGWRFRRTREMHGVLERKLNEVCWILHLDNDDSRDAKVQGMETVAVDQIVKRRRIRLTNQPFPALSWREDGRKETSEIIDRERVLVCRFKHLCFYADAKARTASDCVEEVLDRLREDECDRRPDNNITDDELRYIWRGHTVPGGAQAGWLPGEKEFLRQEGVSHRGIASRSSLKASSGLDFPVGDPMKRGSIGPLLTEYNLPGNYSSGRTKLSIQRLGEQRYDQRRSRYGLAGFASLPINVCDSDTDGECDVSGLSQAKRKTENIIDLTRPQASSYGYSSRANSSMSRQPSPLLSLHKRLILASSQPTSARRPFYSRPCLKTIKRRQDDDPGTPAFPPVTYVPRARTKVSPPNPNTTSSPSSLRSKISRHQNQTISNNSPASKSHTQRYTFGDCFCGAGGMSRGAVSAGLRVNWGFDFDLAACQSYRLNFFGTQVFNVWANQFSEADGEFKVDICHMSTPCQFFSGAHTIQGKDDDMNTASLFAVFNLLEKARPRVVTLEQTSGLIQRHPIFFNALINMFTSRGFSVRWKVINCADFGLPQRRMRLFIIASW